MLAIIPARQGSKGIPGKNIKELCGRPLIEYTIEEAKKAKSVSRIIISTDSEEIANISINAGAEVPFLRPANLASDKSLAIDTYIYTCDRITEETGVQLSEIVVLQPTSPLRESFDIDEAIRVFYENRADSVISVVELSQPIEWVKRINSNGVLASYVEENSKPLNRQNYEKLYVPNGAIYIFNYDILKLYRHYYSDRTYPYVMPQDKSIDIDVLFDFDLAEYLMNKRLKITGDESNATN